ncbi:MAG: imidazole glycerol phosphate synthase subunit HisH [Gammaproteobacteria bacterium]
MSKIAIIDYGMGNLHSIGKAVKHVAPQIDVSVTADAEVILTADRIIFPGVGGIEHCMAALVDAGLDQVVLEAVKNKPVLGICVGMQALLEDSEENNGTRCLGIFDGHVRRFRDDMLYQNERLKVPHMGWNEVQQQPHALWHDIPQSSRFYFVHSYYAVPDDADLVVGTAEYGQSFACALARENVFAVQFHPEKSQHAGLQLLENFTAWSGE